MDRPLREVDRAFDTVVDTRRILYPPQQSLGLDDHR